MGACNDTLHQYIYVITKYKHGEIKYNIIHQRFNLFFYALFDKGKAIFN